LLDKVAGTRKSATQGTGIATAMTVRSIMTPNPLTLRSDDTVARAAELMLAHRYLILPVVDAGGRCAGMFDMWDLLTLLLPKVATLDAELVPDLGFLGDDLPGLQAKLKEVGGQPVGPLARPDLPLLKPDTPVVEALLLSYRNRTTLPVVDQNNCVIGVLSYWDVLAAIATKK
jgi:CBS domain-containing protein